MSDSDTMNIPITKGGFSNDGSGVLTKEIHIEENNSYPIKTTVDIPLWTAAQYSVNHYINLKTKPIDPSCIINVSLSSALWSSGMSICEYYDIQNIVKFISDHAAHKVAIQFPDHLITDAPNVVDAINYAINSLNNPNLGEVGVYVLGDTSYGSCCIDEVASQHIDADVLVHLGFACLSPSKGIPIFHSFGQAFILPQTNPLSLSNYLEYNYGFDMYVPLNTPSAIDLAIPSPLQTLIHTLSQQNIVHLIPETEDDEYEYDEYDYDEEEEDGAEDIVSTVDTDHSVLTPNSMTTISSSIHPKKCLLMLYDRSYTCYLPHIVAALRASRIMTFTTDRIHALAENITIVNPLNSDSCDLYVHNVIVVVADSANITGAQESSSSSVFIANASAVIDGKHLSPISNGLLNNTACCSPDSSRSSNSCCDDKQTSNTAKTSCCVSQPNTTSLDKEISFNPILNPNSATLTYSGYSWPIHPFPLTQMSLTTLPPSFLPSNNDESEDSNQDITSSNCTSQTKIKIVNANKVWENYFSHKQWTILFLSTPQLPSLSPKSSLSLLSNLSPTQSSSLMSTHLTLNFPFHNLTNTTLPAYAPYSTSNSSEITYDDTLPPFMTLTPLSGTSNRVMSRRFYMVEKAKNANIFGIVVCTLVAQQYMRVIKRLQTLIKEQGKKSYVLVVGKVNEPKLLNFPDVEMFIMVSCPLSVMLQNHSHTSSVDLITAVEAELALGDNRTWTGQYSTDQNDIFPKTGRLGQGMLNEDDKQYLKKELYNLEEEDNTNYDTEIIDVQEDVDEVVEDESDEPRFSAVDGRYHVNYKKQMKNQDNNENISYGLIEVGGNALIDPGYKPYERTFTGLDPNYKVEDINMKIQPGLHGTARGYITIDKKDQQDVQKF